MTIVGGNLSMILGRTEPPNYPTYSSANMMPWRKWALTSYRWAKFQWFLSTVWNRCRRISDLTSGQTDTVCRKDTERSWYCVEES